MRKNSNKAADSWNRRRFIGAVVCALPFNQHDIVRTQAVPTLVSQRRYANNEAALAAVFDRFARWQAVRAFLQLLAFIALLLALATGRSIITTGVWLL